ncbi:YiiX/YebB-like N1pC/P60 family cysteine hydrolase [Shewanella sp.]|uniref:YiiX/YebB-like N1pC/P60 family cysteine hydrolase n=1 Tax=Shewanella sp. TaxID=50422 RepID=UPI003563D0D8
MKKSILLIVAIITLTACMARTTVSIIDKENHDKQSEIIKKSVLDIAKTGDWLVIRGYHSTDNLVANATGLPISHVGIINHETQMVVEADGQGIHFSNIDEFIDKSYRLIIIRPRWKTVENAELAWKNAESLVGSDYDFLGTVGVNHPDKYYCSELAVHIYSQWFSGKEKFPSVVKPGELYLWGTVLYDSLPRDEI